MSSLALLAKNLGWQVNGSDIHNSSNINLLKKEGINVFISHSPENMRKSKPNLVVYSSVIKATNCERKEARKRNLPLLQCASY